MPEIVKNIALNCTSCGACRDACDFLTSLTALPAELASSDGWFEFAFGCSLCGACQNICPHGLPLQEMFLIGRQKAVEEGVVFIDDYRYLFPDRVNNANAVCAKLIGTDLSGVSTATLHESVFFPGCSIGYFSPALTHGVHKKLDELLGGCSLYPGCCGKTLEMLGLPERDKKLITSIVQDMAEKRVKRVITACPNCYYHMLEPFAKEGIEVCSVYEFITAEQKLVPENTRCIIHDSCPDRQEGIFAQQVRLAATKAGYKVLETGEGKEYPCCGSGGMVAHFYPELTENLIHKRLKTLNVHKCETVLSYCLGCTMKLCSKAEKNVHSLHILNVLLGIEQDYIALKEKAKSIMQNEKIWHRIMDEGYIK